METDRHREALDEEAPPIFKLLAGKAFGEPNLPLD